MLKRKSQQLTYTKENGASVSAAGGGFHCHQTHNNSQPNHAILISANMTPHKNRFHWCSIKDFYWLVANVFR